MKNLFLSKAFLTTLLIYGIANAESLTDINGQQRFLKPQDVTFIIQKSEAGDFYSLVYQTSEKGSPSGFKLIDQATASSQEQLKRLNKRKQLLEEVLKKAEKNHQLVTLGVDQYDSRTNPTGTISVVNHPNLIRLVREIEDLRQKLAKSEKQCGSNDQGDNPTKH